MCFGSYTVSALFHPFSILMACIFASGVQHGSAWRTQRAGAVPFICFINLTKKCGGGVHITPQFFRHEDGQRTVRIKNSHGNPTQQCPPRTRVAMLREARSKRPRQCHKPWRAGEAKVNCNCTQQSRLAHEKMTKQLQLDMETVSLSLCHVATPVAESKPRAPVGNADWDLCRTQLANLYTASPALATYNEPTNRVARTNGQTVLYFGWWPSWPLATPREHMQQHNTSNEINLSTHPLLQIRRFWHGWGWISHEKLTLLAARGF